MGGPARNRRAEKWKSQPWRKTYADHADHADLVEHYSLAADRCITGWVIWDPWLGDIRARTTGGMSMPDPLMTIDLGHSSTPDAVATPWEETRRVLETAEVFWLATVRTD